MTCDPCLSANHHRCSSGVDCSCSVCREVVVAAVKVKEKSKPKREPKKPKSTPATPKPAPSKRQRAKARLATKPWVFENGRWHP